MWVSGDKGLQPALLKLVPLGQLPLRACGTWHWRKNFRCLLQVNGVQQKMLLAYGKGTTYGKSSQSANELV